MPSDVTVTTTRNYGETAKDKSDELLEHLLLATLSVTLLVALFLGWRESGVVLLAIPVTLALTMSVFYFLGYTINRVTLFALIFSASAFWSTMPSWWSKIWCATSGFRRTTAGR